MLMFYTFFGINTYVVTKLWSFSSILLQYGTSKATVRKDFKILKICFRNYRLVQNLANAVNLCKALRTESLFSLVDCML